MKYFFFIILTTITANAQISTGYSMGIFDGNAFSESTFSYPISVNSNDCYFVTNTLLKFWEGNTQDFVSSCDSAIENSMVIADMKYLNFPVQVYPNPVINFVEIIFLSDLKILKSFDVNIFSTNSTLVLSKQNIPFEKFKKGHKIDLSLLAKGVYYLSLSSDDFYKSFKIIKH